MSIKINLLFAFLFFIVISFYACKSKALFVKPKYHSFPVKPDFDQGETTDNEEWQVPKDGFHFVTPRVEAYLNNGFGYPTPDLEFRGRLIKAINRTLRSEYQEAPYHYIDVMKGSYKSLNETLESQYHYKLLNPNRLVELSDRFIVTDKKYGVCFSVQYGCCGDVGDLILTAIVINNESQTIQKVYQQIDNNFRLRGEGILERKLLDMINDIVSK